VVDRLGKVVLWVLLIAFIAFDVFIIGWLFGWWVDLGWIG
jgi:hypothetical protein